MASPALALSGRPGAGRRGPWAAFAAGVVLSVARRGANVPGQSVVVLFIAPSAPGFPVRARG